MKLTRQLFKLSLLLVLSACERSGELSALGTIERDRIIHKATAAEIILEQPVKEGRYVQQGTLLVKLDNRRQLARTAKAEADVARMAAIWEKLRNGARVEDIDVAKAKVNGAMAALTVAEKNYQRTRELSLKKLNTQAQMDAAVARRDSAEAELESARKHLLVLTNGTRKEDLEEAEATYKSAQAQLTLEQIQLGELNVVATRDGLLDSLPWNTGERVAAGSAVAIVLAGDAPYARVYVPEPARASLKVGAKRSVIIDGMEETFEGQLRWISSDPAFTPYYAMNERDRSRLVYLAEFELPTGTDLASGVPAEVLLKAP